MRCFLDCVPCFITQAISMARMVRPDEPEIHERITREWAGRLAQMEFTLSPPELAEKLYPEATRIMGCDDPFAEAKQEANDRVLQRLPELRTLVENNDSPLKAAMRLAIIGNSIDYGAPLRLDWEELLDDDEAVCLEDGDFALFDSMAKKDAKIVILGDNAGEIGLDTLVVQELNRRGCHVTFVVRGAPIINDATLEDAEAVGMTELCTVLSSGLQMPGTVLDRVSPEVNEAIAAADAVVCKGQGNFESLYGNFPDAFFAFKIKCSLVRDQLNRPLGESVFIRQHG